MDPDGAIDVDDYDDEDDSDQERIKECFSSKRKRRTGCHSSSGESSDEEEEVVVESAKKSKKNKPTPRKRAPNTKTPATSTTARQSKEDPPPSGGSSDSPNANVDLRATMAGRDGSSPTQSTRIANPSFSPAEIAAATAAASAAANSNVATASQPSSGTRSGKKKTSPGQTTARQVQKKKKQTAIRVGCRAWAKRKSLVSLLNSKQKEKLKGFNDRHRCHGTVMKPKGKNAGCPIIFDELPANDKVVVCGRKRIFTCHKGEEEIPDPTPEEECDFEKDEIKGKPKKLSPAEKSVADFKSNDSDSLKTINKFQFACGEKPEEVIDWTILGDTEQVKETDWDNPFSCPLELDLKKDIDMNEGQLDKIFFAHFFPSVEGHAKKLDEYLSDPRAPYYQVAKNEKISFHDPEADDPDWTVKQCYLLIIAAVTEADVGVDNLWKRGDGGGRHPFANFGRYIPKNVFKCWQSGAALMFCDSEYWCADRRDRGWEIFDPCLASYNDKRKELFQVVLCVLDESMCAWKPKTSKTGGLPNITSEPRKPCDLGTQFKNAVECISGTLVFQEVVGPPETMRTKGYHFDDDYSGVPATSVLPGEPQILSHVACVKRQVRGAAIKEGGWVSGDAWFGSVVSAVEVMREFKVHSTFVIKKHHQMFPKEALEAVMKARHGSKPQGHWVVARATISGVQLMAIACAWSQKGIAYFISACGSSEVSPVKHEAKFEDDWGNASFREVNRPKLLHLAHECLPLIDEHNKQRQSLLQLERRWLAKDPWFRLVCTLVGMSIVDMHRCHRCCDIITLGKDQGEVDALRVLKHTDMLCGNLREWRYKQRRTERPVSRNGTQLLERITDEHGNQTTDPTPKQQDKGLTVGNPIVRACFTCRRHMTDKGMARSQNTSWRCTTCKMPICKVSRVGDDGGRELSCLDEHLQGECEFFLCREVHKKGTKVPAEHQVDLHPRGSNRRR